jgi:hypothetical protein
MSELIYTSLIPGDIAFDLHPEFIAFAIDGSAVAGKLLMSDASILIRHGLPLPEPLAGYIGDALYRSSLLKNSVNADVAFNLRLKSTHDRHAKSFEYRMICFAIELEHRGGLTYDAAFDCVGERFGKSRESVRRIRSEHKEDWDIAGKSDQYLKENIDGIEELLRRGTP